jgi:hypothetical protein
LGTLWGKPYSGSDLANIGVWSFALNTASTLIGSIVNKFRLKDQKDIGSLVLRSLRWGAAASLGSSLFTNTLYFLVMGLFFNTGQFGSDWQMHRISFDLTVGSLITMPLGHLFRQMFGENLQWRQAAATFPAFWREKTPTNFLFWAISYWIAFKFPFVMTTTHLPIFAGSMGLFWSTYLTVTQKTPLSLHSTHLRETSA